MKRLLCSLTLAAALWGAACSGGGTTVLPPPVGGFSNADLNGTYSFVTNGEVFTGAIATPLARTGSFVADGKGGITGGVEDINSAGAFNGPFTISGGSYGIGADGRGAMTLTITSNGTSNNLDFGITLTSSGGGLMIDETSSSTQASTGSGNFIIQKVGPFAISDLSNSFVFDFAGLNASNAAESFVGEFTSNATGVINSGFFDDNNDGTLSNGAFIGTLAPDLLNPSVPFSTSGRGVAQIAGQNFVFYIVDSTRVRFLSTNGGMLSGDAVIQSNNIPTSVASLNSGFVFIVAGSDDATKFGPLTRLGRFTASGATVTNVLVDTNDAGSFTPTDSATNASISLDAANPGRGTVTFLGNGLSTPFTFVFYLSSATRGVIQETTLLANGFAAAIADGTIAAQTGGPFSSTNITGGYAINWSGLSVQNGGGFAVADEEDLVGQAKITSLSLSGAADIFQFQKGVPQIDNSVSGPITISGDGTGGDGKTARNKMTVTLTKGSSANIDFVVYFVSPQLAFIASNGQPERIVAGVLQAQP